MSTVRPMLTILTCILLIIVSPQSNAEPELFSDLLVYGGTAAGTMAAYSAARQGSRVTLLEPGGHLGGMVTGGLSATDLGDDRIIGGYARMYYRRVAEHYGWRDLAQPSSWLSEPHVAEQVFDDMLREAGVRVIFHARVRERNGVGVQDHRIVHLITEDERIWRSQLFVDASYNGDVLSQSGAGYTWGRESSNTYGESLGGVRAMTPQHQFAWPILAYRDDHHLYPEISDGPLGAAGSGDRKVQAYNFRLILTDDPANRLPLPKPDGYDAAQFALLAKYLKEFEGHLGREPRLWDFFMPVRIPNHKADFNNNGPISTDYIGHSSAYPDATYDEKRQIRDDHLRYTQSLLYFLAHDPAVPTRLRNEIGSWGLAKDEFEDTGHWPRELYIREGRRMIGTYILTQADLQDRRTKWDSIGMGAYNSDAHNVQRIAMPDGSVRNEGDMQVPVSPYEIPYRAITPRSNEVKNLLVPVCLSASHVAYASLRMEPQFMIIGQAAGVAAALAVRDRRPVQDIDVAKLQHELRKTRAVLSLGDEGASNRLPPD
ncbi:FAD-dependent oxidoreductase [Bradyrhizobium liaoningense]|nr:FAD-dependent oxidoreductase [Bradyrhizobium liaoningense]